jgi:response regulator RpfG family c-di-GMP phosphodiesterase
MATKETIRVLLIEDNPGDVRLVRETLAEAGAGRFLLSWSPALQSGMDHLGKEPVDVILLDLGLPDSTDFSTFEKMHARAPQIPIILLTGLYDEALAAKAVRAGAQDYLVKDEVGGRILGRMIRYAIERKRSEESQRESENRLKEAQVLGRVGSWEFDLETKRITWSEETYRLYERDPKLGPPSVEEEAAYYPPEQAKRLRESMMRAVQEKSDFECDLQVELHGRKRAYFSSRMHPVQDAQGRVVKLFGTVQDITARKQHERELEAVAAVSAAMRGATTRTEMVPVILDQLLSLMDADGIMMALPVPGSRDIQVELGRGAWAPATGRRITLQSVSAAEILADGRPFLRNDIRMHTRPLTSDFLGDSRSIACLPLITQGETVGLLWLGSRRNLTENDIRLLNAVADIAASAVRRASLYEQTEERLRRLDSLRTIDKAITGSVNLEIVLSVVTRQAIDQLKSDAASILFLNPSTSTLTYAAGSGFHTREIEGGRLRLGEGIAGRAALERRTIEVDNIATEPAMAPRSVAIAAAEGFVSHYATALVAKGQVKGVLEVFHRTPRSVDREWIHFLETLAEQAAIAIDSAQLFEGLQRSNVDLAIAYDATIEGWSTALDLRDRETEGHTQRVTEMTLQLARSVGVQEEALVHIRRGALLHDIGKMGIPDSILHKPGPLSDEEWKIMRMHPTYAFELLSPIVYLRRAIEIPYCHHEKWDGSGYPRGLKGKDIPLSARLFAVVDVFDALQSQRPYRDPWPREKILEHIRSEAGRHFDPDAVPAFLAII